MHLSDFFPLVVYDPRLYYRDQDFGSGYFSRNSGREVESLFANVLLVRRVRIPSDTLAGLNYRGECFPNQAIRLFDPRRLLPAAHRAEKVIGVARDNLTQFHFGEGLSIGFDPEPIHHLCDSLINPVVADDVDAPSFNRLKIVFDPSKPGLPEHQGLLEISSADIIGSGAKALTEIACDGYDRRSSGNVSDLVTLDEQRRLQRSGVERTDFLIVDGGTTIPARPQGIS